MWGQNPDLFSFPLSLHDGNPGLSNLWQMAGRNYFFLKLAGQYTNNILLDV